MIGSNIESARYSGINTRKVLVMVYVLSGVIAAIAGIIMLARFNSVRVGHGESYLLITVLAMAGSLLCLYLLRRFVFHLDRYGLPQGSAQEAEETEGSGGKADNSLTKWIVLAVALGMLAGYFVIPDRMVAYCGRVIDFGLYLLLFLVGMDMGRQGTMLADIKAAGLKVLLVPVAVAAGTLGLSLIHI